LTHAGPDRGPRRRLARTFRALAEPNFRRYYLAQGVSLMGTWLQFMGQIWLVVEVLAPGSGLLLGLTAALQSAPMVLALWGGAVADTWDKRRLLLATQTVSGLLALVLGIAVLTGWVTLALVWVCAVALGAVNAADAPARQAFASELVADADRTSAIGLNNAAFIGTRAVGVALTPLAVSLWGLSAPFLLNAASFAIAVAAVARLDRAALRTPDRVSRGHARVRDGLSAVRRDAGLLAPLVVLALVAVFVLNFNVTLPLLAVETLGGGLGLASTLLAVSSAASVVSSLYVAGLREVGDRHLRLAGLILAAALCAVAAAPSAWLACLLMIPVGAGTSAITTTTNTLLQQRSDPGMRGRIMSLFGLVMQGSALIGGPVVGAASDAGAWGAAGGLAIGAAAALLGVCLNAYLLRSRTPAARA
jgi:MFS family permease